MREAAPAWGVILLRVGACYTSCEMDGQRARLWAGSLIAVAIAAVILLKITAGQDPEREWRSNEAAAVRALFQLGHAETDFRSRDLNKNGVRDFWTGDIVGLWKHGGRISREIAEADVAPLKRLVDQPRPYHGYFFRVLEFNDDASPPEKYKIDTDKSGRAVHNLSKFAFCAYPADYNKTGKRTFLVHESLLIGRDIGGKLLTRWPSRTAFNEDGWTIID